ncbi:MAG: response regulator [Lachnospiraceae bacterium]|nr:response regulator [Lachnospiraceae bacterium]
MDKPLFSEEIKSVYEHSAIPLAVYYVEGGRFQTYLVSDGFCRAYETTREDLVMRLNGADPFVNILEKQEMAEAVRDFSDYDAEYNIVFHEYVGPNRRLITVHAIGNHEYTPDGRRYSVIRYHELSDIAQRKLFRNEEEQLHMALDGLSRDFDVIWLIDCNDHTITLLQSKQGVGVVQGAVEDARKLGVYENAVAGLIKTRIVEEDRERLSKQLSFEELEKNVPETGVYSCNYRQHDEKGGYRYLQMCFAKAEWNGVRNFIVGIRNVESMIRQQLENQRKLEEALERAEAATKAKSAFLFNMSHDIRTPLNAILGFVKLAREKKDSDGKLEDYLDKISISGEHLLSILNEVLEMARIENNRLVITTDLYSMDLFLSDCKMMMEGEMKKKNLTLVTERDLPYPYLYFDREHMLEVCINILSNAVKYTPPGGTIRVSTVELPGDTLNERIVEFVIEDTGCGMSEDFVEHAFDAFERERTQHGSGVPGTGLGLAIVKRLVDLMGGTIRIESKLGVGTKVIMRLPMKIGLESEKKAEQTGVDISVIPAGMKILLAEDNELNAEIAIELLSDRGFQVDLAENGAVCLEKYASAPVGTYDVILMDVQMPVMDGYTATKQIRQLDARRAMIPIIAMTANAFKEDVEKAMAAGMDRHVAKPIDVTKLEEALVSVLKR